MLRLVISFCCSVSLNHCLRINLEAGEMRETREHNKTTRKTNRKDAFKLFTVVLHISSSFKSSI